MKVLNKLIENQNLCKLLQYNDTSPLSGSNINDTSKLLFNKIYPFPFTPEVDSEASSIINVLFDNFELNKSNSDFKNNQLVLIVICHNDLWKIDGMLRPFAILNELDNLFNLKNGYGIGKNQFGRGNLFWANEKYSGYRVTYELCDFN